MIKYLFSKLNLLLTFLLFFTFNSISRGQSCAGYPLGNVDIGMIPKTMNICFPLEASLFISASKVYDGGNPNAVGFRVYWGDGTNTSVYYSKSEVQKPAPNQYEATVTHKYSVRTKNCFYKTKAMLLINGSECASVYIEKDLYVWDTDNEGSGELRLNEQKTNAVIYKICAGQSAALTFVDNSNFNCNLSASPSNPNVDTRWIQFQYGTNTNPTYAATPKIPNVKVGATLVSNAAGVLTQLNGPVQTIPVIASGSGKTTSVIYIDGASTVGKVGASFEITLRNWNVCNKYDDAIAPAPGVDGDNPPKTTTGIVEVILAPPPPVAPSKEICYGGDPKLTATASMSGTLKWYSSAAKTTLLATSATFDPKTISSSIATTPGVYKYYVTETLGSTGCESLVKEVVLTVRDNLNTSSVYSSFTADANDYTVCAGETDAIYKAAPAPISKTFGGATSFIWSPPSDWTLTSSTTTATNVTNIYTIGTTSGTRRITATLQYTTPVTNGSYCPVAKYIDVVVNALPTATFGNTQSICNNTAPKFQISSLTGSGNYNAKYRDATSIYNFNNGSNFSGNTTYTHASNLTVPENREFYLSTLTDVNTGCVTNYSASSASNRAIVTVREALNTPGAISGLDVVCASEPGFEYTSSSAQFPTQPLGGATRYVWQINTPTNAWTFSDNTTAEKKDAIDNKMQFTSGTGNGSIQALIEYSTAITDDASNFCRSAASSKTVTAISKPVVTISSSTPKICTGTKPSLTFNISGGVAPYEIVYKLGATLYTLSSVNTTTYTITFGSALTSASVTDYTFELVSIKSQTSPYCNGMLGVPSSTVIKVYANPSGVISPNATICAGESDAIKHDITGTGPFDAVLKNVTSGVSETLASIPDGYQYNVTPLVTTQYQLVSVKMSNSPNCSSTSGSSLTITVNPPPTKSNAGADVVLCNLTTYTLGANTPTAGTGVWELVSKPSGKPDPVFSNINLPNSSVTIISGNWGEYIFRWKISQASCIPSTDDVSVTFGGDPSTPDAGPNASACFPSYTLNGSPNPIPIGVGAWSLKSGPGTTSFSDNTKYNSQVTVSVPGTYVFEWTISSGSCPAKKDEVTISFDPRPQVNAGLNDTICANQTAVALNGTISNAMSNYWEKPDMTALGIDDVNNLSTFYHPLPADLAAKEVTLLLYASGLGSCSAVKVSSSKKIIIDDLPIISAGADATTCGNTFTLAGSKSFGAGKWTKITGSGAVVFSDVTSPTSTVTVNKFTTYQFVWTVSNGKCVIKDTVQVRFYENPTGALAGTNFSVCGLTATLAGTSHTYASGSDHETSTSAWTKTLGTGSATFLAPTSPSSGANVTSYEVYTFKWTETNGPCSVNSDVKVTYNQAPVANPVDAVLCEASSVKLDGDPTKGTGTITTHLWGGDSYILSSSTIQRPNVKSTNLPGTYNLTYTVKDDKNCSDIKNIQVIINALPVITSQPINDTICETEMASFQVSATGVVSYQWQIFSGGSFVDIVADLIHSGFTGPVLSVTNGVNGTRYRCRLRSAGSCDRYTNEVTLVINSLATIISQPGNKSVCEGVSTSMEISATGSGLNYQWQYFDNPTSSWTNVPSGGIYIGGTTAVLNLVNPPVAMSGARYRCILTTTGSCKLVSNEAILTVYANPVISIQPKDKETCEKVATTISVSNTGPAVTYKWQIKSGGSFVDISPDAIFSGDDTKDLKISTPNISLNNTIYRCKLTAAGGCQVISNSAILDITLEPSVYAGDPGEVCSNIPTYTIKATSGTNASNYSKLCWSSSSGGSFTDTSILLATYKIQPADISSGKVNLTLKAYGNGSCSPKLSQMNLSVTSAPSVDAGKDGETCQADTFSFAAIGPKVSNYSSLLWSHSGTGSLNNNTQLKPIYTPSGSETGTIVFSLQASGNGSCIAVNDQFQLVITPKPVVDAGSSASTCAGTKFNLANATIPPSASEYSMLTWTFAVGSGSINKSDTIFPTYSSTLSDAGKTVSLTLVANGNGSCPASLPKSTTLTIKPLPKTDPISGPKEFCVGTTQVYRTDLPTGSPLSTYTWGLTSITNAPAVGMFNNTAILDFKSNAYNGKLYVVETNNGCSGDTVYYSIRSYNEPIIEAGAGRTFCLGSTETLGGTPTAIGGSGSYNYIWSPAIGLNDPLVANPVASPLVNTQYTLSVSDKISGCNPVTDNVTIFVNPIPAAPGVVDKTACYQTTIPSLEATGNDIKWYDETKKILLHSGNIFNTGKTEVGTYTYYATQTIDGCTSPFAKVSLTIYPVPAAPLTVSKTACQGKDIPLLEATGTNIRWYSDMALTMMVSASNSYNTGKSLAGVYKYYVTQSLNNCSSNSTQVNLTIFAPPAAPVVGDTTVCKNQTIPALKAVGDSINWYANDALTIHRFFGNTYNTGQTEAGSYMYFVTQTKNGCASSKSIVTLTINPVPIISGVSSVPQSVCNSKDGSITIMATGVPPLSYSVNGGTGFTSSNVFNNLGQGAYPVKVKNGFNCIASSSTILLQNGSAPPPPIANNDKVYCQGDFLTDMTATGHVGGKIRWYSDPNLKNLIDTFRNQKPMNLVGTTNYYVTETKDTCQSAPTVSVITINPIPTPPIISDKTICENQSSALNATGTNVKWYTNASASGMPLFSGNTYSPANSISGEFTFYATQTVSSCVSVPRKVVLTINATPLAPGGDNVEVCSGNATPALVALGSPGSTFYWFNDLALTSPVYTGNPLNSGRTVVGSYDYYVIQEILGCKSAPKKLNLKIAITPDAPVANDLDTCVGVKNPVLKVAGLIGSSFGWYSNAALSPDSLKSFSTSTSFNTGKTKAGTYKYWVTQTLGNCISKPDPVALRINALPLAPTVPNDSSCFGAPVPLLRASGADSATFTWYSGAKKYYGETFNTSKTAIGTYSYAVTQTVKGCESPETNVTFNIRPNPKHISNSVIHETYCNMNDGGLSISATYELSNLELPIKYSKDNGLTYSLLNSYSSLSDGLYFIKIKNSYGCVTDGGTITVNPGGPPPAPVASGGGVYCKGAILNNLTAKATLTGSTLTWYNELHQILGTGTSLAPLNVVGIKKYYVTETFGGCESPSTEVSVTIYAIPSVPKATDATICAGEPVPTLTATGTNVNWYSSLPVGPAKIIQANSLTFKPTAYTAETTHSFYVTQTINGCESPADTSTYVINPIPPTLIANDTGICFGQVVPSLVSSNGTNIKWYSDRTLKNVVGLGKTFSTGKTKVGQYKYFVNQTVKNCVSKPDSAVLRIDTVPSEPFSSNERVCLNAPYIPYLKAYGSNIKWYVNSSLTDVPVVADSILPTITGPGKYIRFVTQSLGNCESPAFQDTLTVLAPPPIPIIFNANVCFGNEIPLLKASGTNLTWYSFNKASVLCKNCTSFDSDKDQPGIYRFYVTQSDNFCESDTVGQTLEIYALPVVKSLIADGEKYCNTKDGSIRIAAEVKPLNYSIDNGLTFKTDSFFLNLTNGSYPIAVKDAHGCVKSGDIAVVAPGSNPPAPIVSPDKDYCFGDSIYNISATGVLGGKLKWFANPALTQQLALTGDTFIKPFKNIGVRKYYVYDSIGTCISPASIVRITINDLPVGNVSGSAAICKNNNAVITFNFNGKAPYSFSYTNGSDLSSIITLNNPHYVTASQAGYYKLTQLSDANGCNAIDLGDSAKIDVYPLPTVTLSGTAEICDDGNKNPFKFDFSGSSPYILKYAINTDTFRVESINASSFIINSNVQGTYKAISLTDNNGCKAVNLGTSASLLVRSLPSGTFLGTDTLCNDFSTPAFLYVKLNGNGPWTYVYTTDGASPITKYTTKSADTISTTGEGTFRLSQISDYYGCKAKDLGAAAIVTRNALPTVSFTAPDSICNGDSVKVNFTLTGKAPWKIDYTINSVTKPADTAWTSPFITYIKSSSLTALSTYKVENVKDNNGCAAVKPIGSKIIKKNPNPGSPSILVTNLTLCSSADGEIHISPIPKHFYSITDTSGFTTAFDYVGLKLGTYPVLVKNQYGCLYLEDSVDIKNGSTPTKPLVWENNSYCFGETMDSLRVVTSVGVAHTSEFNWYFTPFLTKKYQSNKVKIYPKADSLGTVNYYVTEVVNVGCESLPSKVTISINPIPATPVTSDTFSCYTGISSRNPLLISSGRNVKWYDYPNTDSTVLSLKSTYKSPETTPGTYKYYVSQTEKGCPSLFDSSTFVVKNQVYAPIANDTMACSNLTAPPLKAIKYKIRWYNDYTLKNYLDSGIFYQTNKVLPGSYSFYSTQTISGCEGPATSSTLTIKAKPSVPKTKDVVICQGSVVPSIAATGVDIMWYDRDKNFLSSQNPYDHGLNELSPDSVYVFYVTQTVNGCQSDFKEVTVTIKPRPVIPVLDPVGNFCQGSQSPVLKAKSIAAGANVAWFKGIAKTALQDDRINTFVPTDTLAGIYNFSVSQKLDGCESERAYITLKILSVPVFDSYVSQNESYCDRNDGQIVLSATDVQPIRYSIDSGYTFQDEPSFNKLAKGSYQTVIQNLDGCRIMGPEIIIGAGGPPPAPQISPDKQYCYGDKINFLVATPSVGGTITWYNNSDLKSSIATGTNYMPSSVVGAYEYFATEKSGKCESPASKVKIEVNPIPPRPTGVDVTACYGSRVPFLNATGDYTINWYNKGTLTKSDYLTSGPSIVSGKTEAGSYYFYTTQTTAKGCSSQSDTIKLTIYPVPDPPIDNSVHACSADKIIPDLHVNGKNILWFAKVTKDSLLGMGNSFAHGKKLAGDYTFFATQTVNGCQSEVSIQRLRIKQTPPPPPAQGSQMCQGAEIVQLIADGEKIRWYDSKKVLDSLTNYFIPNIDKNIPDTFIYYATQTTEGCESARDSATLIVYEIPDPPITADVNTCYNAKVIPPLEAKGVDVKWYSDYSASMFLSKTSIYDTKQRSKGMYSYYATQTIHGCESEAAQATLTIYNIPRFIKSTLTPESYCKMADGSITITAIGTGGILEYSVLDTFIANNGVFTNLKNGTYYIKVRNLSGCEVPGDTVVIKAGGAPPAPSAGPEGDYCFGQTPDSIRAIPIVDISTISWYSDQALKTLISNNKVIQPSKNMGIKQYYATQTINGCQSPGKLVTISVFEKPNPPLVKNYEICANQIIPDLVAKVGSGATVTWYKDSTLKEVAHYGERIGFNQEPQAQRYFVTQTINGCESNYTLASMIINVVPELIVPNSLSEGCPPLIVNMTANPSNADQIRWYVDNVLKVQGNVNFSDTLQNKSSQVKFYRIKTVASTNKGCKKEAVNDITVYPQPAFDFEPAPSAMCSPARFQFISKPGGKLYFWQYGDDSYDETSSAVTAHNYLYNPNADTTLLVKLTATSDEYNCTDSFKKVVTIYPTAKPNYTVSDDAICAPKLVTFKNTSENAVKSHWNFGDGSAIMTNNSNTVTHTYENKDLLRTDFPELRIETKYGCIGAVRKAIMVKPEVIPDFSRDSAGCAPFLVTFNNLSNGTNFSSTWKYGDGFPDKNDTHTSHNYFNPTDHDTTYYAKLIIVSREWCTDSITKNIVVYPTLKADFVPDTDKICMPHVAFFVDKSRGACADCYEWDFGDGKKSTLSDSVVSHRYPDPSDAKDYSVKLKITNTTNICQDTISYPIVVLPSLRAIIDMEDTVCAPYQATFKKASLGAGKLFYEWNFGDGNISTAQEPTNKFLNSSDEALVRKITLKLTSEYGCVHDTFDYIALYPAPEANFRINPGQLRFPEATFAFTDVTNKGPWKYLWEFGDGDTSHYNGSVSHLYKHWGPKAANFKIPVSLTAWLGTCRDSAKDTVVLYPPLPIAKFDELADSCMPYDISIKSKSIWATDYLWEFGDGTSSKDSIVSHKYDTAGVYTVKLTVSGEGGTDSHSEILVVYPNPKAKFNVIPYEIMLPDDVIKCYNMSKDGASYVWYFGDGNTSEELAPKYKYTDTGKYIISLKVISPYGCVDSIGSDSVITVSASGLIRYPNAFFPGLNGPQDGSGSGFQNPNAVFRPFVESVKEYHFEIYNRWGAVIFSTNDIKKGWDGYYKGKLCPQDVYVYKAWGKFHDNKTFIKAGDITLLHRKR